MLWYSSEGLSKQYQIFPGYLVINVVIQVRMGNADKKINVLSLCTKSIKIWYYCRDADATQVIYFYRKNCYGIASCTSHWELCRYNAPPPSLFLQPFLSFLRYFCIQPLAWRAISLSSVLTTVFSDFYGVTLILKGENMIVLHTVLKESETSAKYRGVGSKPTWKKKYFVHLPDKISDLLENFFILVSVYTFWYLILLVIRKTKNF